MSKLKIASRKSGRLSENSHKLLEECGIKFSNGTSVLKTTARNFPVEILFLRDDDIPQYVEQQVADIGIIGENMVHEKNKDVTILKSWALHNAGLSLAIPKEDAFSGPEYFNNKKVATSYPRLLSEYLEKTISQHRSRRSAAVWRSLPGSACRCRMRYCKLRQYLAYQWFTRSHYDPEKPGCHHRK